MQFNNQNRKPEDMLPLPAHIYYILLALIGKTLHGYQIKKKVEREMQKSVPTGSLYRHLKSMQENGLIEEVEKPIEDDDPRRQYFKLTAFGRSVYTAEYNRMADRVRRDKGLLEGGLPAPSGGVG
jgi:DNA-binding PadR family transcriptional regulator